MKTQYHWYFATFPLPHYDLCINEVYYGFLDNPDTPFEQTNRLKYLGLFPEGQLRTYINRGYIRDYYAKDVVERRGV